MWPPGPLLHQLHLPWQGTPYVESTELLAHILSGHSECWRQRDKPTFAHLRLTHHSRTSWAQRTLPNPKCTSAIATLPMCLLCREPWDTPAYTHFSYSCPARVPPVQSTPENLSSWSISVPAKLCTESTVTPVISTSASLNWHGYPQCEDTCTHKFIVPWISISKIWKQPRYPPEMNG